MKLLVATTNRGKLIEIAEALKGFPLTLHSLKEFHDYPLVGEDQPTFEGNALKKAHAYAQWSRQVTLADDSGLVVPALGGRPGVHSARYAGENATDEDNCKKLLEEMKNIPDAQRQVSFVCVLALVIPDGRELVVEGRCEGRITREPRGTSGFGYDPLFYFPPLHKTTAELALAEKNKISHRGQALQRLRGRLPGFLEDL